MLNLNTHEIMEFIEEDYSVDRLETLVDTTWNGVINLATADMSCTHFAQQQLIGCHLQMLDYMQLAFKGELEEPEQDALTHYLESMADTSEADKRSHAMFLGASYLREVSSDEQNLSDDPALRVVQLLNALAIGCCIYTAADFVQASVLYDDCMMDLKSQKANHDISSPEFIELVEKETQSELALSQSRTALEISIGQMQEYVGDIDRPVFYKVMQEAVPSIWSYHDQQITDCCDPLFDTPVRPSMAAALRKLPSVYAFTINATH